MKGTNTNSMIEDNVPLAYYVTGRWKERTKNYDDTLSCCLLGLVKAAKGFDETKGYAFATFATKCMENEILMYLRKQNKIYKHEELFSSLIQIRDNGDEYNVSEALLEDKTNNNIEEWIDREVMKITLRKAMIKLKPRERQILCDYANGNTQRELAIKYGLSQSYISRIIHCCRAKYKQ